MNKTITTTKNNTGWHRYQFFTSIVLKIFINFLKICYWCWINNFICLLVPYINIAQCERMLSIVNVTLIVLFFWLGVDCRIVKVWYYPCFLHLWIKSMHNSLISYDFIPTIQFCFSGVRKLLMFRLKIALRLHKVARW